MSEMRNENGFCPWCLKELDSYEPAAPPCDRCGKLIPRVIRVVCDTCLQISKPNTICDYCWEVESRLDHYLSFEKGRAYIREALRKAESRTG